jgi:hypothetical protein
MHILHSESISVGDYCLAGGWRRINNGRFSRSRAKLFYRHPFDTAVVGAFVFLCD